MKHCTDNFEDCYGTPIIYVSMSWVEDAAWGQEVLSSCLCNGGSSKIDKMPNVLNVPEETRTLNLVSFRVSIAKPRFIRAKS